MHEDTKMRLFVLSLHLEDNLSVRNWYEGFPCKRFSSLMQFINAFNTHWGYYVEEQEIKAMIKIIWEENLGEIQTLDDAREGTKDDIPFEFEDHINPIAT